MAMWTTFYGKRVESAHRTYTLLSPVAGCLPYFKYAQSLLEKGGMSPVVSKQLCDSMDELCEFLFIDGLGDKKRQKLIRNFGVIEIIVQCLQLPFGQYHNKKLSHVC